MSLLSCKTHPSEVCARAQRELVLERDASKFFESPAWFAGWTFEVRQGKLMLQISRSSCQPAKALRFHFLSDVVVSRSNWTTLADQLRHSFLSPFIQQLMTFTVKRCVYLSDINQIFSFCRISLEIHSKGITLQFIKEVRRCLPCSRYCRFIKNILFMLFIMHTPSTPLLGSYIELKTL